MHHNQLGGDILDQIIYRGEGNSSIVIALKTHAKVIRLLKKDGKIMRSSQDHHVTQHPMRTIKFIHLIMKPLTEPFLSGATELIHLKSDFINQLSKRVEAHRPLHRLDKTLHLDDQYALVMDDLCALPTKISRQLKPHYFCGPTISVEIKPKQGFLPKHRLALKDTINDQLAHSIRNCCLYGSAQYLKLSRGRISQPSDYCPINLFSGCPIKMKSALENLIKNPQNNLRVFKDLALAYDESSKVKLASVFEDFFDKNNEKPSTISQEERLVELLIKCLLNDHSNKDNNDANSTNNTESENTFNHSDSCLQHQTKAKCKCCDTQTHHHLVATMRENHFMKPHKLPTTCVLYSVLIAQKLDTIGAHTALYMLNCLITNARSTNANIDVLEELSKPQLPKGFGTTHQLPQETREQYYFRKVWEFLVSLTAKDCSIIVTLRRLTPDYYQHVVNHQPNLKSCMVKDSRSDSYYMFNVGIADLDQKMPLKISRICDNLNLILKTRGDFVVS